MAKKQDGAVLLLNFNQIQVYYHINLRAFHQVNKEYFFNIVLILIYNYHYNCYLFREFIGFWKNN